MKHPHSKKSYKKRGDYRHVREELKKKTPIVIRFYKASCPACQMSEPAWNEFRETAPPQYRIVEVEEEAIPPEVLANISAFPTYAKLDANGPTHTVGAITEPEMIVQKLRI
jgi:hypothetical protein